MWNKNPAHFRLNAVEYKSEMYRSEDWKLKTLVKCDKKSNTQWTAQM